MLDHGQGNNAEFTYWLAEDESVTQGVLEAVSAASNTAIVPDFQSDTVEQTLDPLYKAIDPDALNSLFASKTATTDGQVEFQYYGYRVTVDSEGYISLTRV